MSERLEREINLGPPELNLRWSLADRDAGDRNVVLPIRTRDGITGGYCDFILAHFD